MNLQIHGNGVTITDELRHATEGRILRSLARFAHRVRSVRVHFTDLNGPRGGVDVRCRVEASVDGTGRIVVHETHENPWLALARAADVAARGVSRRLGRARDARRRRARLAELRRRRARRDARP